MFDLCLITKLRLGLVILKHPNRVQTKWEFSFSQTVVAGGEIIGLNKHCKDQNILPKVSWQKNEWWNKQAKKEKINVVVVLS